MLSAEKLNLLLRIFQYLVSLKQCDEDSWWGCRENLESLVPLLTFPLLVHPPCFSAVWTNIDKFKFKTGKGQGPKRTYNGFFLFFCHI